jgi:hypothetical protein
MSSIYDSLSRTNAASDSWQYSSNRTFKLTQVTAVTSRSGGSDGHGDVHTSEDVHVWELDSASTQPTRLGGSPPFSAVATPLMATFVGETRIFTNNHVGKDHPRLRMISIIADVQDRIIDLAADDYNELHNVLGHTAARAMSETILAGANLIPQRTATVIPSITSETSANTAPHHPQHPSLPQGYISFHPKLTLTYSHNPTTHTTTMICIADPEKLAFLESLLSQPWLHHLLLLLHFSNRGTSSPAPPLPLLSLSLLLPPLLTAFLFTSNIDTKQSTVRSAVRQIEVRTGHHEWKHRAEPPALGQLTELVARMSGAAMRVGSWERKMAVVGEVLGLVEGVIGGAGGDHRAGRDAVAEVVEVLKQRLKGQDIESRFTKRRIEVQLDAVSSSHTRPKHFIVLHIHPSLPLPCLVSISPEPPGAEPCKSHRNSFGN